MRQKRACSTRTPVPGSSRPLSSPLCWPTPSGTSISRVVVAAWLLYMLLVSAARFLLVRRYWRASPSEADSGHWNVAFVVGTAMAAAGWGAAAIVLYAPDRPMNEAFLVFVVGGVMLGGASLLAARPEAFLTFLLPTGLLTALRVASEGDEDHLMMGFLGRRLHRGDGHDDLAIPSGDRILVQAAIRQSGSHREPPDGQEPGRSPES